MERRGGFQDLYAVHISTYRGRCVLICLHWVIRLLWDIIWGGVDPRTQTHIPTSVWSIYQIFEFKSKKHIVLMCGGVIRILIFSPTLNHTQWNEPIWYPYSKNFTEINVHFSTCVLSCAWQSRFKLHIFSLLPEIVMPCNECVIVSMMSWLWPGHCGIIGKLLMLLTQTTA